MYYDYTIVHKFKVAFMTPAKTGTTSILALALNHDFPKIEYEPKYFNKNGTFKPRKFLEDHRIYYNRIKIPADIFNLPSGYKCCMFVRNPYDRVFGSYKHHKYSSYKNHSNIKLVSACDNFTMFVDTLLRRFSHSNPHFYSFKKHINLIHNDAKIYRFEDFEASMKEILNTEDITIPRLNSSLEMGSYKKAYNLKTRLIISDIYRDDLRSLNYDFDGYGSLPSLAEIRKSYAYVV